MTYIICLAFAFMCIFYLMFQRMKGTPRNNRPLHIAVKCAATSMAVLVALLGCLKTGTAAHWVLLAGLVACAIADGVLCVHFLAGGAIFALGHVLYMASFVIMHRPNWFSLLLFLALMGLTTSAFTRFRPRIGRRAPFFYAYATILSVMVALAAAQYPLYFAGALLFAFSDGLLGYLLVDRNHVRLDYISLGAYYLGQFLLGLAVYVF